MSFHLLLLFLALTVLLLLFYAIPVRVYRKERQDERAHSQVGLIGRSLANNPSVLYWFIVYVALSLCVHFGLDLLPDLVRIHRPL
jgi:cbb3-type cytochrome oxidase subunit 3